MSRSSLIFLLTILVGQPGCIWKLWSNEKPIEERIFDVYGTVQSISEERLVLQTKKGKHVFMMVPSSIKGSDFRSDTYVHVYYRKDGDVNIVTMVVEKIK